MHTVIHNNRRIDYTLVPSKRTKCIAMRVKRDVSVEIRAPHCVKPGRIEDFVRARAGWIIEKQNYFRQLAVENPPKEFRNGEAFQLLAATCA